MNIYVGNLAWKTKRKELKELFENFGEVTNAFIVRDKETRRSRGFGFVEMAVDEEAQEAIDKLNNTVFLERTIIVNEARPKDDSPEEERNEPDYDSERNIEEEDGDETVTDNDGNDADNPGETGEQQAVSESSGTAESDNKKGRSD